MGHKNCIGCLTLLKCSRKENCIMLNIIKATSTNGEIAYFIGSIEVLNFLHMKRLNYTLQQQSMQYMSDDDNREAVSILHISICTAL